MTFVILLIYMVATTTIDIVFKNEDDHEKFPYLAYDGILRVSKFIVDLYLYVIFIVLYSYFFKLKKELKSMDSSND